MRPFLPIFAVAMAMSLPAFADEPQTPQISISGKGEIVAAPDMAAVNAGVTTESKTAREALDANTKAMSDLMATLKAAKIDDKDIQTSGFSVSPVYVYPNNQNGTAEPPHITGYSVANSVHVKIRQLGDLGTILDQIVSAGGNTINSVSFSVDDPAKLLDEARKAAFSDAESKARIYADAANVGLGPVMSITEGTPNLPGPQPVMYRMAAAPAADAVPVSPGQLTFDVDVSVVWALKTGSN